MGIVGDLNYAYVGASILTLLGGSPAAGEAAFFVLELTLACMSFYVLIRAYTQYFSVALVSSLAYLLNPVFLFQLSVGPFVLMAYATLPLVLFAFLRLSEVANRKRVLGFLIVFVIPNFFDPFAFEYEFLLLLLILLPLWIMQKAWTQSFRMLLSAIAASIISVLVLAPAYASAFFELLWKGGLGYNLLPLAVVSNRIQLAYGGASITNLFRLLAGPSSSVTLYLAKFSWSGIAGFGLLAIGSIGFLFQSGQRAQRLKIATGIVALTVIGFIALVRGGFIPTDLATAIFEDPERLMFMLALSLCLLVGCSLDALRLRLSSDPSRNTSAFRRVWSRSPTNLYSVIVVFLLCSVVVYNAGGMNGDDNLFQLYNENVVAMPAQYTDALHWLLSRQTTEPFFRTLWLPTDFYTFHLITPSDPYVVGSEPGSEQYGYPNIALTNSLFNLIATNSTEKIGLYLAPLSVKYVIVPDIINYNSSIQLVNLFTLSDGIVGSPNDFTVFLNHQSDLKEVYSSTNFSVYQNLDFIPQTHNYDSSLLVMDNTTNYLQDLQDLFDFPGYVSGQYLPILSGDVSPNEISAVSGSVNYLLYVNPSEVAINESTLQLYDFTNLGNHSGLSVNIETQGALRLGLAVESSSPIANATIGSQTIHFGALTSQQENVWYFGTIAVDSGSTNLTSSLFGNRAIQQIVVFKNSLSGLPGLLNYSSAAGISQQDASGAQPTCSWTALSESYSSTWLMPDDSLHVMGFHFDNAFCAKDTRTIGNALQIPYLLLVICAFVTLAMVFSSYLILAIRDARPKAKARLD